MEKLDYRKEEVRNGVIDSTYLYVTKWIDR